MGNQFQDIVSLIVAQAERDDGFTHLGGADFVELVDLAQNQALLFGIRDPESGEKAEKDFPVAEMNGEITDFQFLENLHDNGGNFGVIGGVELVLADDVDIALVEFAESSALRTLAAIDALDL